ncbi:MAG: S41 family peptidase, partial [Candidatus Krumholzibacteriia bacterium]
RVLAAAAAVLALVGGVAPGARAQTKLLRFPDISGDRVAFCYAGDIWTAPAGGGLAARVTAHPGQELFPRFSPDGRWIAFTGQYDGDEQVYIVPAEGGEPRRLTWYPAHGPLAPRHGVDNQVYGWTPDGKAVLVRSMCDATVGVTSRLYTVSTTGGLPEALPMPAAGAGDFSPDARRVVYSPLFRDFRSWKRYAGGRAEDLFLFDLAGHAVRRIAATPRTERDPMWIGGSVYFTSDRDGTLNLYRWDEADGAVTQLTRSTTWDVRWPGTDHRGRIVYELGGELVVYDIAAGAARPIAIEVPDDGLASRPSRVSATDYIEDYALSPQGERALFVARGDIFTAPIEKGPTRNLTHSSNAHDKWARWSPDGAKVAFISDRSGEDEVWLVAQDGRGEPEQLTHGGKAMRYAPEWSPDGRRLAFSDKDGRVYVLTLADRGLVQVADDRLGQVDDYAWSPDSRWLAFSLSEASGLSAVHVWDAQDGRVRRVTDGRAGENEPVWDPEGKYLFLLARHDYAPQISSLEWNYAGNRTTGVFALALRRDVPNLFGPQSDEVAVTGTDGGDKGSGERGEGAGAKDGKEGKEGKGDAKGAARAAPPVVTIDFDGLAGRIVRVPLEADNISGLAAAKGFLFYVKRGAPFYGRESYAKPSVRVYDLKERKESELAADAGDYVLSRDGNKLLAAQGGAYKLYDARPKPGDPKTVGTGGLVVDRVPAQEWAQIFNEVWRRYRDFFYVENMNGYDWQAIGDRYRALLPYVAHRSDLTYILTEMVAELNAGHCYIEGGDFDLPVRAPVGLPGARFALDPQANRYRLAKIFRGDNAEPQSRAPLTEVGVDAREGDYVLAIDGVDLPGTDNPYRLLQHKTDPVTLTVNARPTLEGARTLTYVPVRDESALIYADWVASRRAMTEKLSDGRIGYLHLPDMGAGGIAEFIKWFYPQIRREGLLIDVRDNGGGNVSQWILERLDNQLLGTRFGRISEEPATYPYTCFYGHLACLINENAASDGDIFPYRFREAGLGPLIGKRTWGGVVGISGRGPLIDGGRVFVPENGTNSPTGEWIIEGHGVDPDIEVENDPASLIAGGDPQLERGVKELLAKMAAEPRHLPSRPADPVKTK